MSSFLFDGLALLCSCLFPLFRRAAPEAARNAVPDLACERALGERVSCLLGCGCSHTALEFLVCVCVCVLGAPSLSLYFSLAYSQISEHANSIETEVGRCVCVCV